MSLITISGYPCSGKTRRAEQIKTALDSRLQDASYEGPRLKVVILSDDTLNISRDAYKGACVDYVLRVLSVRLSYSFSCSCAYRFTLGKAC